MKSGKQCTTKLLRWGAFSRIGLLKKTLMNLGNKILLYNPYPMVERKWKQNLDRMSKADLAYYEKHKTEIDAKVFPNRPAS